MCGPSVKSVAVRAGPLSEALVKDGLLALLSLDLVSCSFR